MYNYSKPYEYIEGSFIRNILQLASQKEYISFAGGLPTNELFPKSAIQNIFERYAHELPSNIFQYAPTAGLPQLIKRIQEEFTLQEPMLLCSGAQQALDMVSAIFINEGDKVLVEEPSFLGATGVFKSYGAICDSVKLNDDGVDLIELEMKLKLHSYKFFYIIPNFQNPSSITYSSKKRKALAKLAKKYNLLIVEDDPYAYLHFKNKIKKKVFDYAPDNTIYIGSFSKIFIPALRLGYIMANEELMEKLIIAKQYKDLHSNLFSQYILYAYLQEYDIFKHIKILQKHYHKKYKLFYTTLKEQLSHKLEISPSKGGMFVWCKLKDGTDSKELFQIAVKEKVLYVPGIYFCENIQNKNYIRFNYTNSTNHEIIEGIKRLKKVFL